MYGLKRIRKNLTDLEEKADYLVERIKSHPDFFEIHTYRFLTVLWSVKDKGGKPSNKLTKAIGEKTKNIYEGFSTPGEFKGNCFLRIVVGIPTCEKSHLDLYLNKIIEVTKEMREAAN